MLNNMMSLRFWVLPLFLAGVITVIVTLPVYFISKDVHSAIFPFVMIAMAIGIGVYLANPERGGFYNCPKCGKGIRQSKGATVCHHCGFDTATMSYNR